MARAFKPRRLSARSLPLPAGKLLRSKSEELSGSELTQARLIIEVLSPTTQQFDRGPKLLAYQQLAGLSHVILISSTEQAAWACSRCPDGTWSPLEPWAHGTVLPLADLGVGLPWDEVYDGVGLD